MTTKIYTSLPGIRARRRSLGMQAAPLAETIGVSRAAWSQWEAGQTMPSAGLLPALAELLQCSIEDLYRGGEETDGPPRAQGESAQSAERGRPGPSAPTGATEEEARDDDDAD